MVYLFLADGFEEIEALATVDLLRRADIQVITVSVGDSLTATGAHGIAVQADIMLCESPLPQADMLICPGGMPGASNLAANTVLASMLKEQYEQGRYVAAICAAPAVTLAPLGILRGRHATCYPGFETRLAEAGAIHTAERVVTDGNIITANGPSSAIPFALAIISALRDPATAKSVAQGILL